MFLILTMSRVSAALTDNLVGYWKLDETSGTTAIDSLDDHNGLTNATVNQAGIINTAYSFNGTNQEVKLKDTNSLVYSDISLAVWVYLNNLTAEQYPIYKIDSTQTRRFGFQIWSNRIYFSKNFGSAGGWAVSKDITGMSGAWHYIVATHSDTNGTALYWDGNLVDYNSSATSTLTTTTAFEYYIGRFNGSLTASTNYWFNGKIDEVGLWNKVLTSTEVTALYNGGAGYTYPFAGLQAPAASVGTGTYNNNFSVTLDNNSVADIYYTTDGSDPDNTDTEYTGAISITATTTLKAISWVSDEDKSAISSYTYTMVVADPSITETTDTYNNDFTTTITCATTTASIYYTTNGDTPDTGDTLYSGAISITGTTTLKAKAFQTGYTDSGTDSETYTMVIAGTPTADKDSGLYYDPFNVTLTKTGTTTGTKLTYTLNGDAPTIASAEYSAPLTISASLTLKFAEFKTGYTATSIVTKTYEVREPITNFYFYDENTLSAIATVTITDANGSTYTSDVNGLWTTSLSNIAKSFTISKTGYDTRDLEFYFKRQDANFNFMLSQDDNSSSINFLVKDANDNLWANKYLMFVNDTNIITSVLTSATGYATANILPAGDYNALLYNATGDLNYTYAKTTVTVNKPKNEITLGAISPYDITVGGLLGYLLTNQSAASVAFNVFAGTTDFYHFSVVDYNAVAADRKYIPRQYFTQVPMGTEYSSTLLYQPYLLLETDAVVPKITVLDTLNNPLSEVDIFISRYMSNVLTIVESGKTTAVGTLSFSAYPLEYYYISVIYNGLDKGTYRVQPRESTDNFTIVIDTLTASTTPSIYVITADFSDTNKVVNIDDSNITVDVTVKQTQNLATDYNMYLIQGTAVKASTSGTIASKTKNITHTFNSAVVDQFNNNLIIKLVINYPDGNQTFYYTISATKNEQGLMYFAPKMVEDIGQPLAIILAILITGIILAAITLSGLNIGATAIAILGILILGVFMFLGWLDLGVTVAGFDIARFFYILMAIAMIYMLMRGEQNA
jgi:hypothetical protein